MTAVPARRHDGWLSGVLSVLTTSVLVVVVAAAAALAVVPKVLDGAALTVLTGSMVPTYRPGDMVVVRGVHDAEREVEIGDVVSFQPLPDDPTLITHRVVAKTFTSEGTQFVTRGDANSADDDPLMPVQIKGEAVYSVPWVGHVSLWLGERRGLAVPAAAVALLAYAVVMMFRRDRRADEPTPDGTAPSAAAAEPVSGGVR